MSDTKALKEKTLTPAMAIWLTENGISLDGYEPGATLEELKRRSYESEPALLYPKETPVIIPMEGQVEQLKRIADALERIAPYFEERTIQK